MIGIKIEKKDLWLLSAIMVFVVAVGYVIAYGGSQPAVMGHIDLPYNKVTYFSIKKDFSKV